MVSICGRHYAGVIVAGIAVLMLVGSVSATVLSPEPCNIMLFGDDNLDDSSFYGLNDAVVNRGSISYSTDHPGDQVGTYQTYNYAGNKSLVFDGSTELIVPDVPAQLVYETGHLCDEQMSAELWFKTSHETVSGGLQILVDKAHPGFAWGWSFIIDGATANTGKLMFQYYAGGWQILETPASVIDGDWHHVAGTIGPVGAGTFDQVLYLDGVEVARQQTDAGVWHATGPLYIGGADVAWADHTSYTGLMDEIRVQAYAMSGAEILESYENSYYALDFLLGDANQDGLVSADDYASVQANFGNTGAAGGGLMGDANHDGLVSADDYASVQANFGNTSGGMSGVPEPMTLALLICSTVGLLGRRKS